MSLSSDLSGYLNSQNAEGAWDSEGCFTLAREVALQKLAGFQLPRPGDWIVKLVQAVVRSGSEARILVQQKRSETVLRFETGLEWSCPEIVESFYSPGPGPRPDLHHLKAALWALTLGQGKAVRLVPAYQNDGIAWDGERWVPIKTSPRMKHTSVVVTHAALKRDNAPWLVRALSAADMNVEVMAALRARCFSCPLPLWVDGLRIDALQNCPYIEHPRHLLGLGLLADPELPTLPIPPGTKAWARPSDPERRPYSDSLEHPTVPSASPAIHFLVTSGTSSEANHWCHWILDGVSVAKEQVWHGKRTRLGLIALLSAEGLPTDLSGFALQDHPARQQRLDRCLAALTTAVAAPGFWSFEKYLAAPPRGGGLASVVVGGGVGALALLLMAAGPLDPMVAGGAFLFLGAIPGHLRNVHRQRCEAAVEALELRLSELAPALAEPD
jgi:hypothetical protein